MPVNAVAVPRIHAFLHRVEADNRIQAIRNLQPDTVIPVIHGDRTTGARKQSGKPNSHATTRLRRSPVESALSRFCATAFYDHSGDLGTSVGGPLPVTRAPTAPRPAPAPAPAPKNEKISTAPPPGGPKKASPFGGGKAPLPPNPEDAEDAEDAPPKGRAEKSKGGVKGDKGNKGDKGDKSGDAKKPEPHKGPPPKMKPLRL